MSKHALVFWSAGGGALAGAAITYLVTRSNQLPAVATAGEPLRAGMDRLAGFAREALARRERVAPRSTAFEEYRSETLRRLEDEEREFRDYLERLRMAKDRAEFEQFMREHGNANQPPAGTPTSA